MGRRAQQFIWLLRLRLMPIVSFNLLNISAGLAALPWRTFAAATALGILPATIVYTLLAEAIVAGALDAHRNALTKLLIAGGLLPALTFAPAVANRLRRCPAQHQ